MVKGVIETVARSTFESTLGRLSDADFDGIEESLKAILGL